jgi:hypothetical protein
MIEILIAALAVYKVVQVLDAISPREAMPWVKVLVGVALGYPAAILADVSNVTLGGLAVATMAGTIHAVLRLITLTGDMARKKSLR